MEPELTGRIVVPGEPAYDAARQAFNTRFNRFPRAIVFARQTSDVASAIRWARRHGAEIRVRSGRHSYEAFSTANGCLVLDVSELNQVDFNRRTGLATVGAGVQLLPLYEALWPEGVVVPAGACPTESIAGFTLGGGFGLLSRARGLAIDNLIDLELVDAEGRLLHVDARHYPDLFWACRGGGNGSFGVVTACRFRTHPIGSVGFIQVRWDRRDTAAVLRTWQDATADVRLTTTLAGRGEGVELLGLFLGRAGELQRLLQPLLSTGSPLAVSSEDLPYIEAARRIAAAFPDRPHRFKSTGAYVYQPLPDAAVATVIRCLDRAPGPADGFWTQSLGGAVARAAPDATAYFHRKARSVIAFNAQWTDDALAERSILWTAACRQALQPYTVGAYANWPDVAILDWPTAYYGSNFERLRRVKARYDPRNVFRHPQSIPPAPSPPRRAPPSLPAHNL